MDPSMELMGTPMHGMHVPCAVCIGPMHVHYYVRMNLMGSYFLMKATYPMYYVHGRRGYMGSFGLMTCFA